MVQRNLVYLILISYWTEEFYLYIVKCTNLNPIKLILKTCQFSKPTSNFKNTINT